jgi:hypothetical protein
MMLLINERRLVREGISVVGVVTKSTPKKRAFWLEYEFRTEAGTAFTGNGYSLGGGEVGTKLWVLYLQHNPWRNQPYPGSNFWQIL